MDGKLISCKGVSFAYGIPKGILQDFSLELGPGLTLLLGPNGCGKSTLLRLAAGIEMPDSGTVFINGSDLWAEEIKARSRLAYLPEYPDLTPYATIREILLLVCRLRGQPLKKAEDVLARTALEHLGGRSVRELSNGQRRRVTFAACIIGNPCVLLLDEPLEGMDMLIKEMIKSWIIQHIGNGSSILLASHDFEPFLSHATGVVTIRNGRAVHNADLPAEPAKKRQVLEKFAKNIPL